jgi:mRNA interferase MazF
MPSTTTYEQGEVVVVDVSFSDGSGTKRRPALVITTTSFHDGIPDIIVCPISSQPRYYTQPGPGDCPIRGWRALKLRYESTVRVSKMLAVDKRIIRRTLGTLSQRDMADVQFSLRAAFGL